MQVTVRFFALLREKAGTGQVVWDVAEGTTVAALAEMVGGRYPGLRAYLPTSTVAVNRAYAGDDQVLCAGDEVAFLPPVGGG